VLESADERSPGPTGFRSPRRPAGSRLESGRPGPFGRLDQQDPAHARCVAACRRTLEAAGLACAVEREIVDGRLRGWIDLLGFDLSSRRLVLAEIKAEIRDVGGLERQVGWYVRACMSAVRDLGWQPKEIAVVVALLATAANDTVAVVNRLALAQAFPMRGAALAAAIFDGGPVAGWGLAMVDPRRRGGHAIQSLRVDGRRSDAPYRDYADFMRIIRRGR
jgi:hypothetical protein